MQEYFEYQIELLLHYSSILSDLKYWNNEVAVQFGIQSIPASFLIDPNGVIIGKDLRGDDLVKALKAVIK